MFNKINKKLNKNSKQILIHQIKIDLKYSKTVSYDKQMV